MPHVPRLGDELPAVDAHVVPVRPVLALGLRACARRRRRGTRRRSPRRTRSSRCRRARARARPSCRPAARPISSLRAARCGRRARPATLGLSISIASSRWRASGSWCRRSRLRCPRLGVSGASGCAAMAIPPWSWIRSIVSSSGRSGGTRSLRKRASTCPRRVVISSPTTRLEVVVAGGVQLASAERPVDPLVVGDRRPGPGRSAARRGRAAPAPPSSRRSRGCAGACRRGRARRRRAAVARPRQRIGRRPVHRARSAGRRRTTARGSRRSPPRSAAPSPRSGRRRPARRSPVSSASISQPRALKRSGPTRQQAAAMQRPPGHQRQAGGAGGQGGRRAEEVHRVAVAGEVAVRRRWRPRRRSRSASTIGRRARETGTISTPRPVARRLTR